MTTDNNIEIKKQDKYWLHKGITCLALMIISIFCALLPLISNYTEDQNFNFYYIGGLLFLLWTALFIYILFKESKPNNALILNAHGFIDSINVGENIEIEWTNVSSVKMLGKENTPFLGVTLENPDIILEKIKKNLADEMRENIEQNLPTILIPQNSVKIPIKELKNLFIKFTREARALESDSQKKTKNNPFSTDDVLRAFGKLPQEHHKDTQDNKDEVFNADIIRDTRTFDSEDSNEDKINTKDIKEISMADTLEIEQVSINDDISSPFEIPEEVQTEHTIDNSKKCSASDDFYQSLREKSLAKASDSYDKITPTNAITNQTHSGIDDNFFGNSIEDDGMVEDIKELLNNIKSSKIAEIEKMLVSDDIPFSLSRTSCDSPSEIPESKVLAEFPEDYEEVNEFEETSFGTLNTTAQSDLNDTDNHENTNHSDDSLIDFNNIFSNGDVNTDIQNSGNNFPETKIYDDDYDSKADTKEFILDFTEVFGKTSETDSENE